LMGLDRSDAVARLREAMTTAHVDADGYISADEFRAVQAALDVAEAAFHLRASWVDFSVRAEDEDQMELALDRYAAALSALDAEGGGVMGSTLHRLFDAALAHRDRWAFDFLVEHADVTRLTQYVVDEFCEKGNESRIALLCDVIEAKLLAARALADDAP